MHRAAPFVVWCFSVIQQHSKFAGAWLFCSPLGSPSIRFLSSKRQTLYVGRSDASLRTPCRAHRNTSPKQTGMDEKADLRILLIDHYDSFTYNLADLLGQLCVSPPTVLAADSYDSWDELIKQHNETLWDGIILSPGPGHPFDAVTVLSRDCVRNSQQLPVLGVCLGHQILGQVYGATVDLAPFPVHGQVQKLQLLNISGDNVESSSRLWRGIAPQNIQVTRYHSLHVTDLDNAPCLRATAVTKEKDEIVMAMEHTIYPHFGVQFHPESIGTNVGKDLLSNFVRVCEDYKKARQTNGRPLEKLEETAMFPVVSSATDSPSFSPHSVYVHKVTDLPQNGANLHPEDIVNEQLATEEYLFWLDEARANGQPTVSILGASKKRVEYWGREKPLEKRGLFVWNDKNALTVSTTEMDVLTYLQREHQYRTESVNIVSFGDSDEVQIDSLSEESSIDNLPFQFRGGHVGYLGYEVRHDTARFMEEEENGRRHEIAAQNITVKRNSSDDWFIPSAAFLWADRSFVYDNNSGDWYLLGVVSGSSLEDMLDWMRSMVSYLRRGRNLGFQRSHSPKGSTGLVPLAFNPVRSRATYNRNFQECMEHIRQGDSYELCLTNRMEALVQRPESTPLQLYHVLRRQNPAPHAAFFDWNSRRKDERSSLASLAICCSSPERFVSVKRLPKRRGSSSTIELQVEAKPIKGTIARVRPRSSNQLMTKEEQEEDDARAQKLRSSVKDRAENLMIVDLLRNDLSRVCQVGSVHVAKLMDIESFATVHQMVSTIRGTLDSSQGRSAVDVLKACFPGGSMTGAPKLRTMELLDRIEEGASRGPYSGCLGYISLNGSMDMNIIIRTAVLTPTERVNEWMVRIGAGGAITALSERADEYEEMMLKASAVIGAVDAWSLGNVEPPRSSPSLMASGALPSSWTSSNKTYTLVAT